MAVQFITGPAGSGKSSYLMSAVARTLQQDPRRNIIIMVPEQATFCYQYELITSHPLPGVFTLEILSFQRLARTVLQQTGGLAAQNIDELGRLLILRRLLQQQPECYPMLNQSAGRAGYLLKLGQAFQELKRYQITSARLADTLAGQTLPRSAFACKLEEVSRLYSQYDAFLAQDCLDSEDMLDLLLNRLQQTTLFGGTEIWVDEFYDFTPQEFAILGELMQQVASLHIVLPADAAGSDLGRQSAFHHTEKTLDRLRRMARERQVEVAPHIHLQPVRWHNAGDLAFLEQHCFSTGRETWPAAPQHLHLLEGQNRQSEVDAAARMIRQLCRQQGYRYSDIGILTRGDQYDLLLETVLTDYDIPYFVDHKETVRQHPLTELLLAVFDILHSRWSYAAMFRFLKTDLLPFDQKALDLLENYVLAYGIRGSAWYQQKDWSYGSGPEEELAMLNDLRRQIALPLYDLQQTLCRPQPAAVIIRALYTLLDGFGVPKRLEALCREAVEAGLLEAAQVHQQIWDKVIGIFDQISRLLPDTPLSAEEFADILHCAFDNLDLGLLPNSLDQVQIGTLSHSRSRKLRAVFVLGLNEGILPARATQDGFFNDQEKQQLRDLGLELSPESREQLYEEQFYIYLALTRASDFLSLSYSLSDEEGKALRPSPVVNRLCRLYPALNVQPVQWPPADGADLMEYLNHPGKAMGLLGAHLTRAERPEAQEIWAGLYNWFLEHPTPLFDRVRQSLLHEEGSIGQQLSSTELYGTPLRLSVSALERYRQCPYSYFLTYGLRLRERSLYQMEAVDVGQFYHSAIEQFSNYLLEHQISWQSLDAAQTRAIMAQIVAQLAPAIQNEILLSSGRYRYLCHRLQKNLERSALLLMEHGKRGDFVPVALEADFGTSGSKLPRWNITLKDGTTLALAGRIDRIETASRGDRCYLRVIDFKSGSQKLSLSDIYYGLKIQLLTYLQVALDYYQQLLPPGGELLPAGVLYYFFRSGILPADGPVDAARAEALHLADMRANGLLLADVEALKLAQRDLSTGTSNLLPVSLLTGAAPYLEEPERFYQLDDPLSIFGKRTTTVVSREQLELLLNHTRQMIQDLGEEIHGGNIARRPCRTGSFIGCQYCGYQAICQIQTVDILKHSQELPTLSRQEIWQRMADEQQNREPDTEQDTKWDTEPQHQPKGGGSHAPVDTTAAERH